MHMQEGTYKVPEFASQAVLSRALMRLTEHLKALRGFVQPMPAVLVDEKPTRSVPAL